jgi:hypothetical protein
MSEHQHEHESGMGHSHDLDPALFSDFAATGEPLGLIMTLHIIFMVAGSITWSGK